MNKKTKIQIGIITVMFLGSAVVLYMGFHTSTPPPLPSTILATIPGAAAVPSGPDALLPYGSELNFDAIDDTRFHYDLDVIKVSPDEVGIPVDNLIKVTTPNPTP